ncbi:hypothetical protein MTP03_16040 [Tsukamurella sp. PLM1]|nr:hypothetical protein MTP03_16040 [Tsukamurella sp. PLM1]
MMVDNVPGMIIAAPRPMTTREAIRLVVLSESAAATDPAAKTAVPAMRTVRRPMRSPSAPSGSTNAARATV